MPWLEKIARNNLGIDYLWHKQLRGENESWVSISYVYLAAEFP